MGVGYNPKIVTSGLVGYWDAGNPKSYPGSGTSWYDISGYNNTGSFVNSPTYSNGSLVFNGNNQYINLGNTPSFRTNTTGTISAWFQTDLAQAGVLLAKQGTTITSGQAFNYTLDFVITKGGKSQLRMYAIPGDGSTPDANIVSDNPLVAANTWCNITVTQNAGLKMYFNGSLVSATISGYNPTTTWFNTINTSNPWVIGAFSPYTDNAYLNYFKGNIAQISIHNRALSAAEISQNFNATRGRFGI